MANGNPFFINPLGGQGAQIGRGLAGLGQVIGERREQQEAQAQQAQMQQEVSQAWESNDPRAIRNVSLKYPQLAEVIAQGVGVEEGAKRVEAINFSRQLLASSPENRANLYQRRIKSLQEQGRDASHTIQSFQDYMRDPQSEILGIEMMYASLDPKGHEVYEKATVEEKPELTANQKDYMLAKKEGFKGSFMEFKQALSGTGKETLEMMKLQTQILDIQDRIAERKEKKETAKQLADKKTRVLVSGIDSILDEADKAVDEAKESWTATGVVGAVSASVPGSPAYNLRRRVQTVQANLGFDKLQQMRDASPTGGALGAVSERELDLLQSTITALDPNMGEERLVEALEKIQEHYGNWRKTLTGDMPEGSDTPAQTFQEGQTATNPETGEKMIFRGGAWQTM